MKFSSEKKLIDNQIIRPAHFGSLFFIWKEKLIDFITFCVIRIICYSFFLLGDNLIYQIVTQEKGKIKRVNLFNHPQRTSSGWASENH